MAFRGLRSHAGSLPLGNKDEDKYDKYSFHYPQQQTARANVMVSLKSVNKLPNIKGSLQLKNEKRKSKTQPTRI